MNEEQEPHFEDLESLDDLLLSNMTEYTASTSRTVKINYQQWFFPRSFTLSFSTELPVETKRLMIKRAEQLVHSLVETDILDSFKAFKSVGASDEEIKVLEDSLIHLKVN